MKNKPNCYHCKHRGTIPGDAHRCCKHPDLKKVTDDPFSGMMAMFASVGRIPPVDVQAISKDFGIVADTTGVRRGWFVWPFSFDPVWLKNCDKFEIKEK